MFGPHLIIDGSRCDTRKLADRILVEQVLNDYPTAIGMTKIGGPYMFEYQAPDPAYSGVSGLVVIAESHIAIHTFPELDYFTMDIFSCKNFDHEKAIAYIKDAFDVREMDRMLVQRGLSFRGPHHGKHGATDELIAAAEARLAAGIVSKEPALPDEPALALLPDRAAALARHSENASDGKGDGAGDGHMVWPQYGVTPDYGTYREDCEPCARGGATVVALGSESLALPDGRTLAPAQPVQVNPTASISGLLDKLGAMGGEGRKMGRALALWEQLARDDDTTIAFALTTPVIASGLRELLVHAVEHRYTDVVVASGDDLFADLYESQGYAHYDDGDTDMMRASDEGITRTRAFLVDFLSTLDRAPIKTSADLWRVLGEALPTRVPRKGLLQAAAGAGVPVFTPDLSTSAVGSALLAARATGIALPLDLSVDVLALARLLAERPRLGIVRAGEGAADALLAQARDIAPTLGVAIPTLGGSLTLGARRPVAAGDHHIALATDATLALPLLVTGLVQRVPGGRRVSLSRARAARPVSTPEEPALA